MTILEKQIEFLRIIDGLKNIKRRTSLLDESRNENSAEHSWHAAIAASILQHYSNEKIEIEKTILMLLIHDIVEIKAGDTFLYDQVGEYSKFTKEMAAAKAIFSILPANQAQALLDLWQEFEKGKSAEAKFAKSIDRFMPVLQNYFNNGGSWLTHGISRKEVLAKNHAIKTGSTKLWEMAESLIDKVDDSGYFLSSIKKTSRQTRDDLLDMVLEVPLHTHEGLSLKMGGFKSRENGEIVEHALIYAGDIVKPTAPILLRINSACYTGDIFHCSRCDCNWQLAKSMQMVSEQGGLIIYHFDHEGRGIGFVDKLKSYLVMDKQNKTTKEAFEHIGREPDERDFHGSILLLKKLGIREVRLISNNPSKRDYLLGNGIGVTEMVNLVSEDNSLKNYLLSKKRQFGHLIEVV